MKVLVLSTVPFKNNGQSNFIRNYYLGNNPKDIIIDYAFINDISTKDRNELEHFGGKVLQLDNRVKRPFRYFKILKTILKQGRYDVLHVHGNSRTVILELIAAKQVKIKTVITHLHSLSTKYKMFNYLVKSIFNRLLDVNIACSSIVGDYYFKNDYIILRNAINITKFSFNVQNRLRIREHLDIGDKLAIYHAGEFSKVKNHYFLIDVFEKYYSINKNSILFLFGEGKLKDKIESYVRTKKLDKCIHFLGNVDNLDTFLSGMDILVFPSISEGFGFVALEAQINGLPCLTSDGIPSEVIISDNCVRMSLTRPIIEWSEAINELKDKRNNSASKTIDTSKYQIDFEKVKLIQLYQLLKDDNNKKDIYIKFKTN